MQDIGTTSFRRQPIPQDRAQILFSHALDAILLMDHELQFVDANPAACDLLGCRRSEVLQRSVFGVTRSEDHERVAAFSRRLAADGLVREELTVLRKDGDTREVEFSTVAKVFSGLHMATLRDITERKRGFTRLEESERRFRQLADNIGAVFWMSDLSNSTCLYISPAYERIWGQSCDSLYANPRSWRDSIHPEDCVPMDHLQALSDGGAERDFIYRVVRPDGSMRWVRDRAFAVRDDAGNIACLAGIAEDITTFKQVEENLIQRTQCLEALADIDHAILTAHSTEAIQQIVLSGIRRLIPCQLAFMGLFDTERAEASVYPTGLFGEGGHSPNGSLPLWPLGDLQDAPPGHVQVIDDLASLVDPSNSSETLLRNGICSLLVVPMREHGESVGALYLGASQSAAFTTEHVEMAGEIAGRFAVALREVRLFEQVQTSQQRLQHVARQLVNAHEAERRRLARELHDQTGQALTAMKVNLQLLKKPLSGCSSLEVVDETIAIIEQTLRQVRELSFDLRPSMLDDLGLTSAVRNYVDRQSQRAGMAAQIAVDPFPQGSLSPEMEIACFRVLQEAVTNVIRHAQARRLRVALKRRKNELALSVADDGVGFVVASARGRAVTGASLGLLGLEERVIALGGTLDIRSNLGHGTTIDVVFPLGSDGVPLMVNPGGASL
ncbi:MAG TPA: PAS domain S-box protein [Pirellulales bacterium]|nr:PAS domain S-box protein [Pirellulales bacterium]